MGNTIKRAVVSTGSDPLVVTVIIGATKYSGTDNDICVRFTDTNGLKSEDFMLDNFLQNDFEARKIDQFFIRDVSTGLGDGVSLGEICDLEVWRKDAIVDDDLFIWDVKVERLKTSDMHMFPIHRWIPMGAALKLRIHDAFLPQDDPFAGQRKQEMEQRKNLFKMIELAPGVGPICKDPPLEHAFFTDTPIDFNASLVKMVVKSQLNAKLSKINTFKDLKRLFLTKMLPEPQAHREEWYWRDDYFGEQRVAGVVPNEIALCTKIPEKLAVTDELLANFLEGKSIAEAIEEKRLFIIDYEVLDGIEITNKELVLCAPIALFYRDSLDTLKPVAIQLHQVPSDDNPVFLPDDSPYLWLFVKMWFCTAESAVHQMREHYGFTHFVMEAMCLSVNQNLSPSHPVFRLLAPHFVQLLAINKLGTAILVNRGGIMDSIQQLGRNGAVELLRKNPWNMTLKGNPRKNVVKRGVGKDVLPHYPYRDDAIALFDLMEDYVTEVIDGVYAGEGLKDDYEVQGWYKSLITPKAEGGVGMQGVPGDGKEMTKEDLIEIVTVTMFTSSVQHAAVNFCQYEQYSSPLVYPSLLFGKPPSTKAVLTECDVVAAFPQPTLIARLMVTVKKLSERNTRALGEFDIEYSTHPPTIAAQERFRQKVKELRKEFLERYAKRKYPYTVLDPNEIPNSISI